MIVRESGIPGLDWFDYNYNSGDVNLLNEKTPDILQGSMPPYEAYLGKYNGEVNDFSHEINGKKYYKDHIPYKPENYHELYSDYITDIGGYSDQVGEMYTMKDNKYVPMREDEFNKKTNYGFPGIPGGLGQFQKNTANNTIEGMHNNDSYVLDINNGIIKVSWLHVMLIFIIILLVSVLYSVNKLTNVLSIFLTSIR